LTQLISEYGQEQFSHSKLSNEVMNVLENQLCHKDVSSQIMTSAM